VLLSPFASATKVALACSRVTRGVAAGPPERSIERQEMLVYRMVFFTA
jgi:hypothetical protein